MPQALLQQQQKKTIVARPAAAKKPKSSSSTAKKDAEAMLRELQLSKEATVEEYLRAYVDHLARDLQNRVQSHIDTFQKTFEKLKRGEDDDENDVEEMMEVVEETDATKREEEKENGNIPEKRSKGEEGSKKKKKKKKRAKRAKKQTMATKEEKSEPVERLLPKVIFRCNTGPYAGKSFEVEPKEDGPPVLIGRSRGRKFRCGGLSLSKDNEVSTNHGRIEVRAGTIFYIDTHSSNGTYINGEMIETNKPVRFASGDTFVMGAGTFIIEFEYAA
eukprot:g3264.t1